MTSNFTNDINSKQQERNELNSKIEEYLAKGNKIEYCDIIKRKDREKPRNFTLHEWR